MGVSTPGRRDEYVRYFRRPVLALFFGTRVEGILLGRDEVACRQLPLELLAVRRALLVPGLIASRRRLVRLAVVPCLPRWLGTCLTCRRNVEFGLKLTFPAPEWKSPQACGQ